MLKKFCYLFFLYFIIGVKILCAEEPVNVKLKLSEIEKFALNNSHQYKKCKFEEASAKNRTEAVHSTGKPQILIESFYRYTSSVPEIELPIKGMEPKKLGDNINYSLGPLLSWTIWDNEKIKNSVLALKASLKAKENETESVRREILLNCRIAYFQTALAGEQIVLLMDALKLSQNQYNDIKINVAAGTKSRMDELSALQEVLVRKKQLSTAMAEMALALRELSFLTGVSYCEGVCVPLDSRIKDDISQDIAQPTVIVTLEPIDKLIEKFMFLENKNFCETIPSVTIFSQLAEASSLAAKSEEADKWPRIQLMLKTSLDYPNYSKLELYNQNSAGVYLNWVFFNAGKTKQKILENINISNAYIEQKNYMLVNLKKEFEKIYDQFENLKDQKELSSRIAVNADELASIIYKSYLSGGATYLEIQNANYKAVEAKIQLAKIKVQMLINLSIMANLTEGGV